MLLFNLLLVLAFLLGLLFDDILECINKKLYIRKNNTLKQWIRKR